MGKTIRLTESELIKFVKKIISEADLAMDGGITVPRDFRLMISPGMNKLIPFLVKQGTPIKFDKNIVRIKGYQSDEWYSRPGVGGDTPPSNPKYNMNKPYELIFQCGNEMGMGVGEVGGRADSSLESNTPDYKSLNDFLKNKFCLRKR